MPIKNKFTKLCAWCHCAIGRTTRRSYIVFSDGRFSHPECLQNLELGEATIRQTKPRLAPKKKYNPRRHRPEHRTTEKYE